MLTLVATSSGPPGGSAHELLRLATGLPDGVVLACPDGPLAERARSEGLRVVPLQARSLRPRDLAAHARDVRRLLREVRPDLLVTWDLPTAIVAPAATLALDPRAAVLMRHAELLPEGGAARLARAAAGRADRVAAVSKTAALDLDPEGSLGNRLAVISPGLELAAYDDEWAMADDPEVLVLGTERVQLALEAAGRAAGAVPRLRLTVAGAPAGAEGERLRERASRPDLEGRVTFADADPDARPALGRAWCLLHCGERDPFPMLVVEALASGRPVVAPAAGAAAEIVDDGCGRLFAPGDAAAAGDALAELLSRRELVERLGAGGRARAGWYEADEARERFANLALEAASERRDRPAHRPAQRSRGAVTRHGAGMAIVTVTHNSAAAVERLLRSAEEHLPGAHVVVVDSGSGDGSAIAARAAAPRATVIELADNVGFARAANAGLDTVEEPVSALIQPDVELLDGSLAQLAADLLAPGVSERILAPAVLSPDGSRQATGHLDPGSGLMWLRALVPPEALPAGVRDRVDPWRSQRSRRVGWAASACLLAQTATLHRLGPFDERIFLFCEDLDLGLRAADAGVDTVFRPDARVLHAGGHSVGPSFGSEPFELLARQRRAVIGERRGPEDVERDDRIAALTMLSRIAVGTLLRRPTERERQQLAAQRRVRDEPAGLDQSS
jgi:GT2 family glycosyltransferase/glycosyltransferase involved in cell wall biosynthesis